MSERCGMCERTFANDELTEDGLCDDCINKRYVDPMLEQSIETIL
jgi:hypothetical protein